MIETIAIGGGPAGLAVGACLKKLGCPIIILEQNNRTASSWHRHYDRLHLHTPKKYSSLPFLKMPECYPKYPSKDQVIAYFESYQKEFNINIEFDTEVKNLYHSSGRWIIQTNRGVLHARNVVMATGNNRKPHLVHKSGQEKFTGTIVHSSEYKKGGNYAGQRVLVVGFGNSACEIALDLFESSAIPAMSVRSPVNIVPREVLGIPTFGLGVVSGILPARWVDRLSAPIIHMVVGSVEDLGLKKLPYGPKEQIEKYQTNPLLDLGTVQLIREGKIQVYGDIQKIEAEKVIFDSGQEASFDHIIYATGYRSNLDENLRCPPVRLREAHLPVSKRSSFGKSGLYFCGFHVSAGGNLREIGREALQIARHIQGRSRNDQGTFPSG